MGAHLEQLAGQEEAQQGVPPGSVGAAAIQLQNVPLGVVTQLGPRVCQPPADYVLPVYGYEAVPNPPSTMEELKAAILAAPSGPSGPGAVTRILASASFLPRPAGFTSLMQAAAKQKQTDKVLELFQSMQTVAGITPNMYSYSTLISALAKAGHWQLAERYFTELQARAAGDATFAPNTVSWAALISAYEKGGQADKALDAYRRQLAAGVEPDAITYSSLIAACERAGLGEAAVRLVDEMHGHGLAGSQALYAAVIGAAPSWQAAEEVFLGMQCAGVEPSDSTVSRLLSALLRAGQVSRAGTLLEQAARAGCRLPPAGAAATLRAAAEAGDGEAAAAAYGALARCELAGADEEAGRLLARAQAAGAARRRGGAAGGAAAGGGVPPPAAG